MKEGLFLLSQIALRDAKFAAIVRKRWAHALIPTSTHIVNIVTQTMGVDEFLEIHSCVICRKEEDPTDDHLIIRRIGLHASSLTTAKRLETSVDAHLKHFG